MPTKYRNTRAIASVGSAARRERAASVSVSERPVPAQPRATSCAGPSPAVAFHLASLLALLRAGEQSAAAAFDRMTHRLSAGELQLALPPLTALIADEQRHDHALAV